jgi:hypothetical protein
MRDPLEDAFLSVIRTHPSDAANWGAWNDWREEHGEEPPGIGLLRDAFARMARLPGSVQDELGLALLLFVKVERAQSVKIEPWDVDVLLRLFRLVFALPLPQPHLFRLRLSLLPARRIPQPSVDQVIGELGHGDSEFLGLVIKGTNIETGEGRGVVC